MADAYLYPGTVTTRSFPSLCTIVGTGQQWADRDDATYVRVDGNSSELAVVQASLPQAGFVPANCTDVQLYVRAAANSTSSSGQGVQVTIWDDAVGTKIGSVGVASHLLDGTFTADGTLVADGTIHEYLFRWSDVDSGGQHSFELINVNDGTPTWGPPTFAQYVFDHPTLILGSLWQPGWLTYYEMWVILIGAADTGTISYYLPTVRRHPVSRARSWPRPATRRNRPVGGYS